jgi:hypothetical protein
LIPGISQLSLKFKVLEIISMNLRLSWEMPGIKFFNGSQLQFNLNLLNQQHMMLKNV